MSPIAILAAVLATIAASAAVLAIGAWLLARAARARIAEQDRIAARVEVLTARRASADSSGRGAAADREA